VEHFLLYDFYRSDGGVDENVFAYSNVHDDERGVVIYHNRFADTKGWIKTSAAYLDKSTGDLKQKSLAEGLGLPFDGYVIFKDYVTHLEYIRSSSELWEKGMYLEPGAYQHHVFMDWRFVDDGNWELVHSDLNGAGVESMAAKWEEMYGTKEEVIEEVKPRKPRNKAVAKKPLAKKSVARKSTAKTPAKKTAAKKKTDKKSARSKKVVSKVSAVTKKTTSKKPKATEKKSTVAKKMLTKKPVAKKVVARKTSKK
jgi:hypothetical protein